MIDGLLFVRVVTKKRVIYLSFQDHALRILLMVRIASGRIGAVIGDGPVEHNIQIFGTAVF